MLAKRVYKYIYKVLFVILLSLQGFAVHGLDVDVNNDFVLNVFPQGYYQFYPVEFSFGGNQMDGIIFWSGARVLPAQETFSLGCTTPWSCETLTCRRQIVGYYYSRARGQRIRPLDPGSHLNLQINNPTYGLLSMTGGLYTDCTSPVNIIDSYAIYGQITHTYLGTTFSLTAGVPIDLTQNKLIQTGSFFKRGLQYKTQSVYGYSFVPDGLEGLIYDSYAGAGSIGNLLSCKFPFENKFVAHGETVPAFAHNDNPLKIPVLNSSEKTCLNGDFAGGEGYDYSFPLDCQFPGDGVIVKHGMSGTGYISRNIPHATTQFGRARQCRDGYLYGDTNYQFGSYTIDPPIDCVIQETNVAIKHNTTGGLYRYRTVAYGQAPLCEQMINISCQDGRYQLLNQVFNRDTVTGAVDNCSIQGTGSRNFPVQSCNKYQFTVTGATINTGYTIPSGLLSGFAVESCTISGCSMQGFGDGITGGQIATTGGALSGFLTSGCTASGCFLSGDILQLGSGGPVYQGYKAMYTLTSGENIYEVQCNALDCNGYQCLLTGCDAKIFVQPGIYKYNQCSILQPNQCATPWGESINHGSSQIAYKQNNATSGLTICEQETRTCTNGVLSGSFTQKNCDVLQLKSSPTQFLFTQIANATLGQVYKSNEIVITGLTLNYTGTIVVTGGSLVINGSGAGNSAFIRNGTVVAVVVTGSTSFDDTTYAEIQAGTTSAIFSVRTQKRSENVNIDLDQLPFGPKQKQHIWQGMMKMLGDYKARGYAMCSITRSMQQIIGKAIFEDNKRIVGSSDRNVKRESQFRVQVLSYAIEIVKGYRESVVYNTEIEENGKMVSYTIKGCTY